MATEQEEAVNRHDKRRLKLERLKMPAEVAAHVKEPTYSFKNMFGIWEMLVRNMADEWEPDVFCDPAEYINDIIVRDRIDKIIAEYPVLGQPPLDSLLAELDAWFMHYSVYDGGAELSLWRPKSENFAERNERWRRKPVTIPWN
ncbi:hypothetical protein [Haloactinospora alba]|uniref:hypothetical protein n=1 Tax=Haloactinospora alba TaxID=405555 RepID=UPI00114E7EED|nr:hypothetical protein [Haloactinospora alba]